MPKQVPFLRSQSIDYERQTNENQQPSSRSLSSERAEELKLNAFKKQGPVRFSDFEILEMIGEGSFGKVFRVRKKSNSAIYAMKSMKKSTLIQDNQIRYAVTEAQIMKEMDHPYVLKLMYTFQTPEYLHMVMEMCEHGDLSQQLDHYQFFDESLARFIGAELVLAMQHVHERNVLYRDLKPENILIDKDGHIKLADFGLAKQAKSGGRDAIAQSFCGSPAYLAPEMLQKAGVSQSGDVY